MGILNLEDKDGKPICATSIIDDERSNGSKSSGSEKQFKDFYKSTTKRQVRERMSSGNIKDIADADGMTIVADMPDDDISEPIFHHTQGGTSDRVFPGNDQFNQGDQVQRPEGGGSGGGSGEGDASDSGEGEDEFTFQISREEYLELLFEDLELPRQDRSKVADSLKEFRLKRSGFSSDGSPEKMDVFQTKKKNLSRKIALGGKFKQSVSDLASKTLEVLNAKINTASNFEELKDIAAIALGSVEVVFSGYDNNLRRVKRENTNYFSLCETLVELCGKALNAKRLGKKTAEGLVAEIQPLLDELHQLIDQARPLLTMDESIDGRYKNFTKKPFPVTQAVMFCLMDVSGSMSQETKDVAKRFYVMLYLFLSFMYGDGKTSNVDIVYLRHHTQAKEVDEEEFFYGRETGGTIVSSVLKLMDEIQKERYPSDSWNIYAAQASDGDNWSDDTPLSGELVRNMLNDYVRYFVYIEITNRSHQTLWREYERIVDEDIGMFIGHIKSISDIYPVFREAFKKDID